ncbi:hypothetical protein LINPERHAP1_LOCUS39526 [Linum perenne]
MEAWRSFEARRILRIRYSLGRRQGTTKGGSYRNFITFLQQRSQRSKLLMSRILATAVMFLLRVLNPGHHGITMLARIVSKLLHLTMLISGAWNMNQFLLQMSNTSID